MKTVKVSWIRDRNIPEGLPAKGRLDCPCGHAPESSFDPSQGEIQCQCGQRYTWDGYCIVTPKDPENYIRDVDHGFDL